MEKIKCQHCESLEVIQLPSGNDTHFSKIICGNCNKFIKWESETIPYAKQTVAKPLF